MAPAHPTLPGRTASGGHPRPCPLLRHPECGGRSLLFLTMLLGSLANITPTAAAPNWVISANESKVSLLSGSSALVPNPGPDTLTLLNFASFPPSVIHITNISNTVLGPPSNVAISPDGTVALIADSIRLDQTSTSGWAPARRIHILDLTLDPPRKIGEGEAGRQVSGLAISPNGRLVLAANRAGGSVSVLRLADRRLTPLAEIPIAAGADEVSDVTFTPDGRRAFASVRERGHLREFRVDGETVTPTGRKFSAYGRPYRVLTTPDGDLLLTAGSGAGNGPDLDAMTVIDLKASPPRSTDLVPIGYSPETIEMSPDGRWVVVILMNGSNLAPGDPFLTRQGQLRLFERRGRTYQVRQTLAVGRIPEGAAFTPDGRHLVVQCHPDRELRVFKVGLRGLTDTLLRIPVPGMPSGMGTLSRGTSQH